jgi:hypothetical protein
LVFPVNVFEIREHREMHRDDRVVFHDDRDVHAEISRCATKTSPIDRRIGKCSCFTEKLTG